LQKLEGVIRTFLGLISAFLTAAGVAAQDKGGSCTPAGAAQYLKDVREASGVAVGRSGLWTINDSGAPVLFRLDATSQAARITVAGAVVDDWEDLAVGQCPAGNCLYIADIGDNNRSRRQITIYRIPEPAAGSASQTTESFHLTYPDQPHDAEALVVLPGGAQPQLFIITKEVPPRVYRLSGGLKPGATSTLSFVRSLNEQSSITGAAASPDGRWVALRSNRTLLVFKTEDFVKDGNPVSVDLSSLNEPQGEGIAFGSGNELHLVSESGGDARGGVLTRVHCAFLK
jgi:hypothetical protein